MKDFEKQAYNVFSMFNNQWGLLSCGKSDHYNCMTISWGSLGSLFGDPNAAKPVATVYINESRYTAEFMNACDTYTISFFSDEYQKDLALLGEISGRDQNKLAKTSLTPVFKNGVVTYPQASITLVCKKLFMQSMHDGHVYSDEVKLIFDAEPPYRMFIGEIIDIRQH